MALLLLGHIADHQGLAEDSEADSEAVLASKVWWIDDSR